MTMPQKLRLGGFSYWGHPALSRGFSTWLWPDKCRPQKGEQATSLENTPDFSVITLENPLVIAHENLTFFRFHHFDGIFPMDLSEPPRYPSAESMRSIGESDNPMVNKEFANWKMVDLSIENHRFIVDLCWFTYSYSYKMVWFSYGDVTVLPFRVILIQHFCPLRGGLRHRASRGRLFGALLVACDAGTRVARRETC